MRARWVVAALVVAVASAPAQAQHISIDGRLSPAQTLIGPNYTIGAAWDCYGSSCPVRETVRLTMGCG